MPTRTTRARRHPISSMSVTLLDPRPRMPARSSPIRSRPGMPSPPDAEGSRWLLDGDYYGVMALGPTPLVSESPEELGRSAQAGVQGPGRSAGAPPSSNQAQQSVFAARRLPTAARWITPSRARVLQEVNDAGNFVPVDRERRHGCPGCHTRSGLGLQLRPS